VWTPLAEKQLPDLARSKGVTVEEATQQLLAGQPTHRFIGVEEIGALAVFLASEDAKSITGANYSIDGGWSAH
jgi:3-hydroxybutyrate dehydrogenase